MPFIPGSPCPAGPLHAPHVMQPTLSLKPFLPFPLEAAATHTHALRLFSAFPAMDPMQKALLAPFHLPLPPRKRHVISCNVCQLRFNSESQATAHYKGGKHAKRLKALEISKAKQAGDTADQAEREPGKDGTTPAQAACAPTAPSRGDASDPGPTEDGGPLLAEGASASLQAQRSASDGADPAPGVGGGVSVAAQPGACSVARGPLDCSSAASTSGHADEPAEQDFAGAVPRQAAPSGAAAAADSAVALGVASPCPEDLGSSREGGYGGVELSGTGATVPCCGPTETDGAKPSKLSPALPSSTRSGAASSGPAEDAKACGDAAAKDEDDKGGDAKAEGDEKAKAALFCSLCKVALNSQSQMEAHNNGSMHKTLLEAQSGGGSIKAYPRPGSRGAGAGTADPSGLQNKVFHCELCDVRVNSETQLKQHITSRRHKDRVAGKPPKPKFSPYTRLPCTAGIISAKLAFPKDIGKAVAPGFFATAAPALTPQLTLRPSPHHASLFSAGPALLRPAPGPMRTAHGSILFAPY
ncbi:zinc finger protein 385D-like isoform X3 [Petromyzon marinus]|uniref:Zinc finger protein 385D-like isoform X3 n=1 Tax=Petromyzon marinus TaxID=7757 RepID=A0AAJ7X5X1_PETMA|nr:zinc finger protein 385D-like isoform X3 [Petromyzon marinus]